MILVNFKVYEESFGKKAIDLAKICLEVSKKSGVEIIPVVGALDALRVKEITKRRVFLQDVGEYMEGAKTGNVSAKAAKALGIDGSLINHSECRKKPGTIRKMLADWPKDFVSVLCLQSLGQIEGWAKNLKTDFVAYEPKYLIGNKEKSVASEEPKMIEKMVKILKPIPVLAGAGVHEAKDVEIALKMGASGILVASDVVKAKNPRKELLELAEAFRV
ncbi:triose-phosphate isomerase [Patescibacteria group bacterium]|nr:triose-phosphate isomerase [Patescibacteria group bacterium]